MKDINQPIAWNYKEDTLTLWSSIWFGKYRNVDVFCPYCANISHDLPCWPKWMSMKCPKCTKRYEYKGVAHKFGNLMWFGSTSRG